MRAAAERILLAAYNRSPRVVRAQLPPDDAVTRRNLIYRHLFQQFDRIDMQVGICPSHFSKADVDGFCDLDSAAPITAAYLIHNRVPSGSSFVFEERFKVIT